MHEKTRDLRPYATQMTEIAEALEHLGFQLAGELRRDQTTQIFLAAQSLERIAQSLGQRQDDAA